MKSHPIFLIAFIITLASVVAIAFILYQSSQRTNEIIAAVNALQIEEVKAIRIGVPQLDIDERIRDAQRSIRRASNRVRDLKSAIGTHADNADKIAQAEQSMSSARRLLRDIKDNSELISRSHDQLEIQFLEMIQLYNQKIEGIYAKYSQNKESAYNLPFWIGIVGIVSSFSAMTLAWRRDNRELIKLKHEMKIDI